MGKISNDERQTDSPGHGSGRGSAEFESGQMIWQVVRISLVGLLGASGFHE